jgi:hypothetical protein
LTFLDLRSNNISNAGLRSLSGSLGKGNFVLCLLDLRGNIADQEAVCQLQQSLKDCGSNVLLRADSSSKA